MRIHTLEQLLNTPIEEIKEGRNIGEKTVVEIETFCKSYLEGEGDIDSLIKKESVKQKKERTFSEDELEKCLIIISLNWDCQQEQKMDYCV